MGREREDQHIYLYVCVNPVAVFGKEKKKPQYFKASMNSRLYYWKKKRNADSVFAFVGWAGVSSLEPQQAWVPSAECRGAGEEVLANVPPAPTDLDCLLPSAWAHNLQIQANPPAVKTNLGHPKNSWASGLESLWKVPWVVCLLVMGFCLRLFS